MSENAPLERNIWPKDIPPDMRVEMRRFFFEQKIDYTRTMLAGLFGGDLRTLFQGDPDESSRTYIEKYVQKMRKEDRGIDEWLTEMEWFLQSIEHYGSMVASRSQEVLASSLLARWVVQELFPALPEVCESLGEVRKILATCPLAKGEDTIMENIVRTYEGWMDDSARGQFPPEIRPAAFTALLNDLLREHALLINRFHTTDEALGLNFPSKEKSTAYRLAEIVQGEMYIVDGDSFFLYVIQTLYPVNMSPSCVGIHDPLEQTAWANALDMEYSEIHLPQRSKHAWERELLEYCKQHHPEKDHREMLLCRTLVEEMRHGMNHFDRKSHGGLTNDGAPIADRVTFTEHRLTPASLLRLKWWRNAKPEERLSLAMCIEECNAKLTAAAVGFDPRYVILEARAHLLKQAYLQRLSGKKSASHGHVTEYIMLLQLLWTQIHGSWPEDCSLEDWAEKALALTAVSAEELRLRIQPCFKEEFGKAVDGEPFCTITRDGNLRATRRTSRLLTPPQVKANPIGLWRKIAAWFGRRY